MTEAATRKPRPRRKIRGLRLAPKKRRPVPAHDGPEIPAFGSENSNPAPRPAPNPIVSPRSLARRTLLALVAIMSFLACLAVAAVSIVAERADSWQRQIAEEVTIQIKPTEGSDLQASVTRAVDIALQAPGVTSAQAIREADAAALLEPWLGANFDTTELPIPRLVALRVSDEVDMPGLARRLATEVPGATLDDHGQWMERLSSMANAMTVTGMLILGLVFAATALCVVFATRGAMAGNRDAIEVLHFVGAEDSYVAGQFQRHFLVLGLKGAGLGGLAAALLFGTLALLGRFSSGTDNLGALFGGLTVGPIAYLGTALTVVLLAVIIAATAGLTVRRTLTELD